MDLNILTREEFEESSSQKLNSVVTRAKQIRDEIRLLESVVNSQEEKIKNYQNTFAELEKELVKVQAKLYAGGTT
jgi:septal ring factor EnvC (AmiA/AmiB activator)